ncbi:MAG: hypothetical protein DKM50_13895 [Candidatus Margulisiibacteriota bacterium]|nr:MAG: hypothetical protein A2X43_09070 [Candidatus Margulisbacteria bacterium GWD2_39_127]OGI03575.1 MAG: hypothetical protein A2X42_00910 [Candidatus Margulisbacteria bacterium GWF2_38_17]OGI11080.1 MAG: hypothetical protein A2X41_02205 [Candidatus Margulisbacteria bacterium GWE2_39_32]PZM77079.1 MAG: hypothetical protein DKM50_13895 [Candidatus Margulisiibacteriota bacterium]HAR62324.1 hypothetical protein [Candidatus Margulisiibacteriota bacterium]
MKKSAFLSALLIIFLLFCLSNQHNKKNTYVIESTTIVLNELRTNEITTQIPAKPKQPTPKAHPKTIAEIDKAVQSQTREGRQEAQANNPDIISIGSSKDLPVAQPQMQPSGEDSTAPPARIVVPAEQLPSVPLLLYGSQPEYPPFAREHAISGHIKIQMLVNEEGKIEELKVLEGNDEFGFITAAKKAIIHWKFEPLRYKGRPVAFLLDKPFKFIIED